MEVNRSRRGGTYPSFEIFNLTEFKYMNDDATHRILLSHSMLQHSYLSIHPQATVCHDKSTRITSLRYKLDPACMQNRSQYSGSYTTHS